MEIHHGVSRHHRLETPNGTELVPGRVRGFAVVFEGGRPKLAGEMESYNQNIQCASYIYICLCIVFFLNEKCQAIMFSGFQDAVLYFVEDDCISKYVSTRTVKVLKAQEHTPIYIYI